MSFITTLKPNEIFVFGSNMAGRHGAGAAKQAKEKFGAIYGQAIGRQGFCYAIPTKNEYIKTLHLIYIEQFINYFYKYAQDHPELTFLVTEIGCGLAGYSHKQIAPLFKNCSKLSNVVLPQTFIKILKGE